MADEHPTPEAVTGEITTLPSGDVVIGAPTATAFAPVSVPTDEDLEASE